MTEKVHLNVSSVGDSPAGPVLWIGGEGEGWPLPCPLSPREALDLARQLVTITSRHMPPEES